MSYNARVSGQAYKMAEAYDNGNKEVYKAEKEKYWQVLEEELTEQPVNGWIDYEDPVDWLSAMVADGDKKEWVEEALDNYTRFCEICKKVTGREWLDKEVVASAEAYLKG